jgi:hypothetical protein
MREKQQSALVQFLLDRGILLIDVVGVKKKLRRLSTVGSFSN